MESIVSNDPYYNTSISRYKASGEVFVGNHWLLIARASQKICGNPLENFFLDKFQNLQIALVKRFFPVEKLFSCDFLQFVRCLRSGDFRRRDYAAFSF